MKTVNNVQRVPKLYPNVVVNNTSNASPNHDSTTGTASTNNAQKKMFYKFESPQLTTSASTSITTSNSLANASLSSNATTTTATATTSGATLKTSPTSNVISITRSSFNDIMRQLFDVKKQTEDLRKQMDLYQKQNEDYRIRLEKLEKEREDGTRQYTNSNF